MTDDTPNPLADIVNSDVKRQIDAALAEIAAIDVELTALDKQRLALARRYVKLAQPVRQFNEALLPERKYQAFRKRLGLTHAEFDD